MATANCVHPHAQLEHAWAQSEQWHEHHNAHWREHCAVLSTPRTVCWCTCVHTSHLWLKVSPCVSFHIIHACALVSCSLSGLSSPVSLLLPPVPLPALPDVHPGAWWDLHGRSPVQLQLREHGQPGQLHTRHRLWAQRHGAHRHQWAQPRGLQRYLLPGLPRRYSLFIRPYIDDDELGKLLAVVVDRTGKPLEEMIAEERESSSAQIRTLLNEQRKNDNRLILWESFSSRTPCSSSRRRTQNSTVRIIAATTGFSWSSSTRSYEDGGVARNSKILPSMSSPSRSSSRIRRLLWNYLEDFKNCKMK